MAALAHKVFLSKKDRASPADTPTGFSVALVTLKKVVCYALFAELPRYACLALRRCFQLRRVHELPRRCRSNDAFPHRVQYGIGKGGYIF